MKVNVILDKARYEVVGMIISILHTNSEHLSYFLAGLLQVLRKKLTIAIKAISGAYIYQNVIELFAKMLDYISGIIFTPSVLVITEISSESLDSPGAVGRGADGSEYKHASIFQNVLDVVLECKIK
jgi:hypothetical protein